jgi:hypothetical protein
MRTSDCFLCEQELGDIGHGSRHEDLVVLQHQVVAEPAPALLVAVLAH